MDCIACFSKFGWTYLLKWEVGWTRSILSPDGTKLNVSLNYVPLVLYTLCVCVCVCVCVCMYALVFQSLSVWRDLKCFSHCLSEGIWSVSVSVCLKGFEVFQSLSVWMDLRLGCGQFTTGNSSVVVKEWASVSCSYKLQWWWSDA